MWVLISSRHFVSAAGRHTSQEEKEQGRGSCFHELRWLKNLALPCSFNELYFSFFWNERIIRMLLSQGIFVENTNYNYMSLFIIIVLIRQTYSFYATPVISVYVTSMLRHITIFLFSWELSMRKRKLIFAWPHNTLSEKKNVKFYEGFLTKLSFTILFIFSSFMEV